MKLWNRDDASARSRALWSRSITRLVRDLARPAPLFPLSRGLYRKRVAAACIPALSEIRRVLDDHEVRVRPEAVARLCAFVTDGARSTLYGESPEAARRTAHEIAGAFVFHPSARVPDTSRAVSDGARALARSGRA